MFSVLVAGGKAVEVITWNGGNGVSVNDVVIYESTVYPGATEDVCLPQIEQGSGLVFNQDFYAGYSPERINPGDKDHRLTSIIKVTSGSSIQMKLSITNLKSGLLCASELF